MTEFRVRWPDGDERDEILVCPKPRRRRVVVTAFVAATALWAVAPFLRLYVTYLSNDRVSVDGWGRVSAAPDVLARLRPTLPDYGVVFVAAAVVNAVAAVVAARTRPIDRAVSNSEFAVGALATAGGLGVAGMLAADLSWMRHGFPHIEFGPAVAVVGIAIVASIIGTVSAWSRERAVAVELSPAVSEQRRRR